MLTRALIVVLAILNVGVASWWLLRSEPATATPPQPATGVAELRWLRGRTDATAVAQTAATAAPTEALQKREAAPSHAVAANEAPTPATAQPAAATTSA